MHVHQAGKDILAVNVDDFGLGVVYLGLQPYDPAVLDQDVQNLVPVVLGVDHPAAFDNNS
jgi:hypothetical protein